MYLADGEGWQTALHAVAEASKVLGGCIEARDALDLAKGKLLRARQTDDNVNLIGNGSGDSATGGGSSGGSGGGGSGGGGGGGHAGGGQEEGRGDAAAVAVAMMAAAPLSREFADKMAELSSIAPELSRLLADLTAVRVDFCFACMFSRLALCR